MASSIAGPQSMLVRSPCVICLPVCPATPPSQAGLLLLVHGEVTDPEVDFFDREKVFIETKLKPLLDQVRSACAFAMRLC